MKYLALAFLFVAACSKEPTTLRGVNAVINPIGNCFVNFSAPVQQFPFAAAAICNTLLEAPKKDDSFRKVYTFDNCGGKDYGDGWVCFPVPYRMVDKQTKYDSSVLECSK
jgi:hypothetical protein